MLAIDFGVYSWRLVSLFWRQNIERDGRKDGDSRVSDPDAQGQTRCRGSFKVVPSRHTRESTRDENPMVKLRALLPSRAVCVRVRVHVRVSAAANYCSLSGYDVMAVAPPTAEKRCEK